MIKELRLDVGHIDYGPTSQSSKCRDAVNCAADFDLYFNEIPEPSP